MVIQPQAWGRGREGAGEERGQWLVDHKLVLGNIYSRFGIHF